MKALDFLARTLFLVVSALATFAILTSINIALHQVGSENTSPRGDAVSREPPPLPTSTVRPGGSGPTAPADSATNKAADGQALAPVVVKRRDPLDEIARWIEALTYAVMALTGFVAAGLVILLRIAFGPVRPN